MCSARAALPCTPSRLTCRALAACRRCSNTPAYGVHADPGRTFIFNPLSKAEIYAVADWMVSAGRGRAEGRGADAWLQAGRSVPAARLPRQWHFSTLCPVPCNLALQRNKFPAIKFPAEVPRSVGLGWTQVGRVAARDGAFGRGRLQLGCRAAAAGAGGTSLSSSSLRVASGAPISPRLLSSMQCAAGWQGLGMKQSCACCCTLDACTRCRSAVPAAIYLRPTPPHHPATPSCCTGRDRRV